ncbi:hypothetical protein [Mycobacterium persicum]|uniref:hypothetical protein n=1 Tax=Mycobacterium persicum TaxID=1487726 RepID=UPI0009F37122|nr:hypothetical protein [Mycobacterium persicum]ORB53672.1 hypothetical protein BST40_07620 [Mycobacterium persicum]
MNRDELRAKYGMDNPPDPDNPIAKAVLDAERVTAGAHGRDNTPLFDPGWSPAMWERATNAMAELQNGLRDKSISLLNYDAVGLTDDLPDDAMVVWAVGTRRAHLGLPHATNHATQRVDWFTSMVQFAQEVDDYWKYGGENPCYAADYELRCTINLSDTCTMPLSRDVSDYGGGTTRLMPVRRGRFVLLFRCCRACEALAGKTADVNFKISVLEAQAKLPPDAVIDPGSPIPPVP